MVVRTTRALVMVTLVAGLARAQDDDARFHDLLRQELRRRASLIGSSGIPEATLAAFGEAGVDGALVASELAGSEDEPVARLGRRLLERTGPPPPLVLPPPEGCAALLQPSGGRPSPIAARRDLPGGVRPQRRVLRSIELMATGDVRDVPEMLELLRDERDDVRIHAACALASCGETAGVPVLLRALDAPIGERDTGRLAELALEELAGRRSALRISGGVVTHFPVSDEQQRRFTLQEAGRRAVVADEWRRWWQQHAGGFDALRTHLDLLQVTWTETAWPSMSLIGRRGDLATAATLLTTSPQAPIDDRQVAIALCGIAARHAGVEDMLRSAALDATAADPAVRALDLIGFMNPSAAREIVMELAARSAPQALERGIGWCARSRSRCGRDVVRALAERVLGSDGAAGLRSYEMLNPLLTQVDCPTVEAAQGRSRPADVGAQLRAMLERLDCNAPGVVIRMLPTGGVALQWCREIGGQGEQQLLGEPVLIEGSIGREAAFGSDDSSPVTRHAMACAGAGLLGARTIVGLVMELRSDVPVRRRIAAGLLEELADLRDQTEPECLPSAEGPGASPLEAPYVRHQLEATAVGADPRAASDARQALAHLGAD